MCLLDYGGAIYAHALLQWLFIPQSTENYHKPENLLFKFVLHTHAGLFSPPVDLNIGISKSYKQSISLPHNVAPN